MEFSSVNTIWVLLGAALVFFMQAGFAMVETGFTRAKNAGNIIMKNLMDFCIGTPIFWLVGCGLMFGGSGDFIGSIKGIASEANYGTSMVPDGVPFWAFLIFQTVLVNPYRQKVRRHWQRNVRRNLCHFPLIPESDHGHEEFLPMTTANSDLNPSILCTFHAPCPP